MKQLLGLIVIAAVVLAGILVLHHPAADAPKPPAQLKTLSFNKAQHSLTDPASIWVVVNKRRPLEPKNYVPSDLVVPQVALRLANTNSTMEVRQVTASALEQLFAAASQNATPLKLSSGYRSYGYQVSLYNGYVHGQGQEEADAQSARPGYSEHQTGLAADLEPLDGSCGVQQCFATTPAGRWLAANSYKYGFIIRYKQGLQAVTGYQFEPWHVRYIGVPLATELHKTNALTLEQFFGLAQAPNYQT